jgi:hypothetical protein
MFLFGFVCGVAFALVAIEVMAYCGRASGSKHLRRWLGEE